MVPHLARHRNGVAPDKCGPKRRKFGNEGMVKNRQFAAHNSGRQAPAAASDASRPTQAAFPAT